MLALLGLILVVVGLVHFYLWKRLVRDPLRPGWARRVGGVVAVGLAVLVPATLIGARGYAEWLAWPGYLWLALMFYLLVTLIPLEIPRAAILLLWRTRRRTAEKVGNDQSEADGGVERRLVLARGIAIFAGLTAAGVTGYGVKTALGPPQINRWAMPMRKLPRGMDGTRLVVVSDIHLGPLAGTHHVGRIVDLINSVKADMVCVVGDLVDGTVAELGRFATPLADIESRYGAYFVTGNHEYYSGYAPWVEEVAQLGVRPLRNERVEINGLDLAGVNDLGGTQYGDAPDFAKALGDRDTTRPVVLMAHQPVAARQAAPFGVDLQVSGHTHGGQMAPFNLVVGLQQPVVSGYGDVDGVPVFVTNGAGTWGPPVRVGAPPQVTVIELRAV
ncbi:metallophosphoesterase [Actinoplanes subtropicus]|uniref:metallophosphoesterase n=1 Tax=Actinoplanes subtropicus TaxID=543632 RepID=UPI0004C34303|nr:metallophosphoesterase [Actinoplanes subtropicus]